MQERYKKDGRRFPNWQQWFTKMKQEFSTKWRASKQPRKQRKYIHNLPLHLKQKMMSSNLDKVLRKKIGRRNIEIRKNDEVKVMRGSSKGKIGKVIEVNRTKMKVVIEGITGTKRDGTKTKIWFFPSNLRITKLDENDKKRLKLNKGEKNAPENK